MFISGRLFTHIQTFLTYTVKIITNQIIKKEITEQTLKIGLTANFYHLVCNFLPSGRRLLGEGGAPPPDRGVPDLIFSCIKLINSDSTNIINFYDGSPFTP